METKYPQLSDLLDYLQQVKGNPIVILTERSAPYVPEDEVFIVLSAFFANWRVQYGN